MGKVLVTGASGFLGSRLVRRMVERGDPVKLLLRPGSSLGALEGIPASAYEVVRGDVTIEHEVYRALAGCDRMLHLAAVYKMWARDRQEILDAAIVGTEATLSAAKKRGLRKIVVTSSMAAVGVSDRPEPLDENATWNLQDSETYVVAKRRAEERARAFAREGLPVVVVNPGGIFGPGDWKPTPSGESILAYLRWRLPIGFPMSEGGLNAVDVDDVAEGHLLALDRGRPGERYILGGENLTWDQLYTSLSELTGLAGPGRKSSRGMAMAIGRVLEIAALLTDKEPPLTYKLARDYVGRYAWVSSAKAERELGYTHRPARAAFLRQIKWYVFRGYLEDNELRRLRLDLASA